MSRAQDVETACTRARELGFIDPIAHPQRHASAAPRLTTLKGATAGLLDNRKGNADLLLASIGTLLRDRYEVAEVTQLKKLIYARHAESDVIDDLARSSDFVVTAIGD